MTSGIGRRRGPFLSRDNAWTCALRLTLQQLGVLEYQTPIISTFYYSLSQVHTDYHRKKIHYLSVK